MFDQLVGALSAYTSESNNIGGDLQDNVNNTVDPYSLVYSLVSIRYI